MWAGWRCRISDAEIAGAAIMPDAACGRAGRRRSRAVKKIAMAR
jgi:hypothetical protein